MGKASISRKGEIEIEDQIHPTAVLKTFVKEVATLPKPLILDSGCICDSNIEFFIHLGCKVFVKDLLNVNAKVRACIDTGGMEEINPAKVQINFEYSANFFDGILLWDIFDHVDSEETQLVVNDIWRVLKKKGWALALFCPTNPTTLNTLTRYRIISQDEIKYETLPLTTPRHKVYSNRDVADLFSNFSSCNSYILKNRWREIIIRK